MNKNTQADWKEALKVSVQTTIRELQRDGTVAMGFNNLAAVVRIPNGGPIGTNARWAYIQTLREVVSELPAVSRNFVKA